MKEGVCIVLAVLIVILAAGCITPNPPTTPTPVITPAVTSTPLATPLITPAPTSTPAPIITPIITPIPTPTPTPARVMPRGTPDASFEVIVYDENKSYFGTTLLADNHVSGHPRIVEVNALGEIIWKYDLPSEWGEYTNPGFDVERLSNDNLLLTLPRKGVYEITMNGSVVWSFVSPKVSHDADRLSNGNTLIAFGASDTKEDAQGREVTPSGEVVWSYYAKNYFGNNPNYSNINSEGWTHTNAILRHSNGSTIVSHRNFNLLAVVDSQGRVTGTIESQYFEAQHDPVYLLNGNLLFATHTNPQRAIELNPAGNMVWNFTFPERNSWPVRDANRLPNGNTLITGADRIVEVTHGGEVVWAFKLKGVTFTSPMDNSGKGFYKAERLEPT